MTSSAVTIAACQYTLGATIMTTEGCLYCAKPIGLRKGGAKYCSALCRQRYWHEQKTGYRQECPKYQKECGHCGKGFHTNDARKKYCTKTCNFHAQNAKRKNTKAQVRECPNCGTQFRPMQKRGVGRTYCSDKCRTQYRYQSRKEYLRSQSWEYRKRTKMDGNWWLALKRDDFTCQLCGMKAYPSQWRGSRKMVVHHLDGTGEKDDKNHQLDNLMTVCQPCHRLFHSELNLVMRDGEYVALGRIFRFLNVTHIRVASD